MDTEQQNNQSTEKETLDDVGNKADQEQQTVESSSVDAPERTMAETAGAASSEQTTESDDVTDTSELLQRAEQAEAQVAEYKDQWLRAVADFKNYKRRAEAERSELMRSASANLILKLLPVIDDFERAIDSVPEEVGVTSWWEGTRLINQKLRTILESEGVTPIEALGKDFDPNFHDAVMHEEVEGQEGKVVAELQKGYQLNDRVLRPSMVKVGKS